MVTGSGRGWGAEGTPEGERGSLQSLRQAAGPQGRMEATDVSGLSYGGPARRTNDAASRQ